VPTGLPRALGAHFGGKSAFSSDMRTSLQRIGLCVVGLAARQTRVAPIADG
jgi:hypothetical protein